MHYDNPVLVREELVCNICYQCRTPLLQFNTFWRHPNKALLEELGCASICTDCLRANVERNR